MKVYRVELAGSGFCNVVDAGTGSFGFFTTFFAHAASAEQASSIAVESVKGRLRDLPDEPGTIVVEEVEEWTSAIPGATQPGLLWFRED